MDDERRSRRSVLAAAGVGIAAAVAGCSLDVPNESENRTESQQADFPDEPERPDGDQQPTEANSELAAVYQEVVDSVVAVRMEGNQQQSGSGTAWAYEDNYFVTNEHVVRAGTDPFLWFTDIGWREAEIVGDDIFSDLAVLAVENKPEEATPLPLVDEPLPVGTEVAGVGNPFELTGSFTTGVISGRNRTIDVPGTEFSIADGIQTDAALNPGNSGGPLITHNGEVTGIINSGVRGTERNPAENVNFAISAAMASEVIPDLIDHGEYDHSFLGVFLEDVRPRLIEANDLGDVTWGVYIDRVSEDGPSDGRLRGSDPEGGEVVRGIETPVGGDVIVKMDDWTIQNRERLSAFLALETVPGDTIEIEVIRDGQRETVDITVGTRPDP